MCFIHSGRCDDLAGITCVKFYSPCRKCYITSLGIFLGDGRASLDKLYVVTPKIVAPEFVHVMVGPPLHTGTGFPSATS